VILSPAGLGTKNDTAGEGQQQFTRQTFSRRGVISSSQTPPLVEKEAPFQIRNNPEKKNIILSPGGTRNQELLNLRGPAEIESTDRPKRVSRRSDSTVSGQS
jgi:hypothetical protein